MAESPTKLTLRDLRRDGYTADQPPQRGVPRDRVVTVVDQQLRPTDAAVRQAEYAKRKAKMMKGNDHG